MTDQRSDEARAYRRWYNTARWRAIRSEQLRTNPLCAMCLDDRHTQAANVCDHIEPHRGDEDLFWSGPFQSLCETHHNRTKQREERLGFSGKVDADGWPTDPRHMANGGTGTLSREYQDRILPTDVQRSAIPLTIVTGPPGSGKSTHIRTHAQPGDLIIDLDAIMQRLSGLPEHHTSTRYLQRALDERNRQLRALATNTTHRAAWFIVSAPNPTDRRTWHRRLGGELVTITTPLAECIRRIEADPTRKGHTDRMVKAAREWWRAQARG